MPRLSAHHWRLSRPLSSLVSPSGHHGGGGDVRSQCDHHPCAALRDLPVPRVLAIAWSLILLAASVAGQGAASPLSVEADVEGAEHDCPMDGIPTSCPAAWESNGTVSLGDDELEGRAFVDEIRVTTRPPVVPSTTLAFAPSELAVEHPVNHQLNRTWLLLNESRPGALTTVLAFESRPQRSYGEDGDYIEEEWGLFLVVYAPGFSQPLSPFAWCYDICTLDGQTYVRGTEDELRPFPNGFVVSGENPQRDVSTDAFMARRFYEIEHCAELPPLAGGLKCDTRPAHPTLAVLRGEYENTTPGISSNLRVNRTTVDVEPTHLEGNRSWQATSLPARFRSSSESMTVRRVAEPGLPASPRPPGLPDPIPEGGGPVSPQQPFQTQSAPSSFPMPASDRSTLVLVVAGTTGTIILLLAWLLYHRISRHQGLDQATRRQIHDAICREPGLRAAQLAARFGLNRNTVRHHLQLLKTWNLVRTSGGIRPRYFPAGQSESAVRLAEVLAHPTARIIHTVLVEQGEADHSRLAATAAVSLPTVGRIVGQLEAVGLATQTRVGRRVIVRPARES